MPDTRRLGESSHMLRRLRCNFSLAATRRRTQSWTTAVLPASRRPTTATGRRSGAASSCVKRSTTSARPTAWSNSSGYSQSMQRPTACSSSSPSTSAPSHSDASSCSASFRVCWRLETSISSVLNQACPCSDRSAAPGEFVGLGLPEVAEVRGQHVGRPIDQPLARVPTQTRHREGSA